MPHLLLCAFIRVLLTICLKRALHHLYLLTFELLFWVSFRCQFFPEDTPLVPIGSDLSFLRMLVTFYTVYGSSPMLSLLHIYLPIRF